MGVLVHPAQEDELANGVALTINQFSELRPAFYINSQLGEVSVTNPTGDATPEQILYYTWYEEPEYEVITRSSLMPWAPGWPAGEAILTDAELDELATISRTSRRSTVCVPVGATYAADGAGGRTLAPPDSWREVCHVGTRPQKVAADRRPAGEAMRDRRQWVVVTDPTVDLLENNPSRLVMLGTLETFTTATANGLAGELNYAVILGAPQTAESATVRIWYLEETDAP